MGIPHCADICYNLYMFSKARLILAAGALALAGCESFETERSRRFVDENGAVVSVEYARGEERTTQFVAPNGAKMPYKSKLKVRVTMPDGERFVAYQNLSTEGRLYVTDNGRWRFLERGVAAYVAERAPDKNGHVLRYQGTLCASVRNPKNRKKQPSTHSSSTPQGFGRDSDGPRDPTDPRTKED